MVCNYRYESQPCSYTSLLKEEMPLDYEGKCPLHSKNIEWKVENGYHSLLKKIMSIYFRDDFSGAMNFDGCFFIAPENETKQGHFGEKYITARKLKFRNEVLFREAIFDGLAKFDQCIFEKPARFDYTVFQSVNFDEAVFNKVYFFHTIFNGYADFQRATFNEHVYFNEAIFHKRAYFIDSVFNSHTGLTHCELHGRVNFHGAQFSHEWGVDFNTPHIHKHGSLLFEGKSENTRIFSECKKGLVAINLDPNHIHGEIRFECAALEKIKQRKDILSLAKKNRLVSIGSKCGSHFEITIRNTDNLSQYKLSKCIIETFSKFLLNEYNLQFNVRYHKGDNFHTLELDCIEYVRDEEWLEMKKVFKEIFNERMFEAMKKDSDIRELLENSSSLYRQDTTYEARNSDTMADMDIDCNTILNKVKTYHELGYIKKIDLLGMGSRVLKAFTGVKINIDI